jgi:mRNA (guanine-N7-)-methyltransferase
MTTLKEKEEILEELLKEDEEIELEIKELKKTLYPKKITPPSSSNLQLQFEKIVKIYMDTNPYIRGTSSNKELEVRFGTRGIKHFTKNDYDNVIKKVKSLGFTCVNENGFYNLRIQSEFLDKNTGKFILSNVRVEVTGITEIKEYCVHNDIAKIINKGPSLVKFIKKIPMKDDKGNKIYPVNFDDFNFRVSLQAEEESFRTQGLNKFIIENWQKSKKKFRYINRVTFTHPDYPILVDISIIKMTNDLAYTTEDAGLFSQPEIIEIELEINNHQVGPGTNFSEYKNVLDSLRKVIKIVLSGLQGTNYPISYPEQSAIQQSYMKLLYNDAYHSSKRIYPSNFIGPSSYTLERKNMELLNENSSVPNIRNDFTVTDKADGDRHMLYINETGKIYLINTSMNIIFTGAITNERSVFHSLLDGELILHDKSGKFINLFACFDIYYVNKKDVRSFTFMPKNNDISKARYSILKHLVSILKPISILKDNFSPIRIETKRFYPSNFEDVQKENNIFTSCETILSNAKSNLYEYNTDGLILTPAYLGVGSNEVGKAGPLKKITWEYSFKWKPPQYNTIDFLVTTIKTPSGQEDLVKQIFEDGTNVLMNTQLNEYKTIILRCTFIEEKHGYINPCQNVIDDLLPEFKSDEDNNAKQAKPVQFYPTNPYDPTAGMCNIMLKKDDNNVLQMFSEENEVFTDNTIVEFSYDLTKEKGWRWVPLRVRHDKTSELRQGLNNFGNAYHVANSNWQSIHNPITEDMISTGINIPSTTIDSDVYYNKGSGEIKTQAMKDFHNTFVKKILIKSVSKKGDILIDFACGKAGDFPKWINAQLSFVFGVDVSRDNLENRLDGACARFLNYRKQFKNMPYALFVNGNSSYNIRNGSAMLNDKAIQITKAVFGSGTKDEDRLGKGVYRQFGKGQEGFNISSCQFAIHYFMENIDTLQGFLRNIAECTKLGGYFIGTCYDGKLIFNLLKNKLLGESIQIVDNGKKIWEITKGYERDILEDNVSCIGYRIDVFQESINQTIPEYLVNFDYLNRIMEDYGLKIIDNVEAQNLGLPEGSGLFSELYMVMMDELKKNKSKYSQTNEYRNAASMNAFEKKISFLNRYFIYKKIRNVNAEKVEIDLEGISEYEKMVDKKESNVSIKQLKKEEKKLSPKIKKLNRKLVLVPATETIEEVPVQTMNTPEIMIKKIDPIVEINKDLQSIVMEPVNLEPIENIENVLKKDIKKRKPRSDIGVKREKIKKPLIIIEE